MSLYTFCNIAGHWRHLLALALAVVQSVTQYIKDNVCFVPINEYNCNKCIKVLKRLFSLMFYITIDWTVPPIPAQLCVCVCVCVFVCVCAQVCVCDCTCVHEN